MARPVTGKALSSAQRTANAKRALLVSGGRRVSINLGPEAVKALVKLRRTYDTDREAIEFALMVYAPPAKRSKR